MIKKFIIFFFFILILIFSLNFLPIEEKKKFAHIVKILVPNKLYSILLFVFDNERNSKRIANDYNVVFLPKTQFINLDFRKIYLNFISDSVSGYLTEKKSKSKSFYIQEYKKKLYILDTKGKLSHIEVNDLLSNKNNFKFIDNNLNSSADSILIKILDFNIFNDRIYVSKVTKKDKCYYFSVDYALLSFKEIKFNKIFSSLDNNECIKNNIQAGRIEKLNNNNILVTTAGDVMLNEDESDPKPQDDKSVFGKILMIDVINNNFKIFSKGHRNSLGILVDGSKIFSTENGPRGGDEINIEIEGGNYGWDIASYGKKYLTEEDYMDHETLNFAEPLYVFVPSIGISEIIKIGKNFSNNWTDNYLVGSLLSRHLFRLKLNSKSSKVLFVEKIFIGERIRDLIYDEVTGIIFLALEDSGSIGVIKPVN